MAIPLKEELHRLIDEIPDTRPEVTRVLFELGLLLSFASGNDELLFRRFVREVAEVQTSAEDPDALMVRLKDLRDRWVHGPKRDTDTLLTVLESAPDDDEPLTEAEVAMLAVRRAAATVGPTIRHDELGRKLQA